MSAAQAGRTRAFISYSHRDTQGVSPFRSICIKNGTALSHSSGLAPESRGHPVSGSQPIFETCNKNGIPLPASADTQGSKALSCDTGTSACVSDSPFVCSRRFSRACTQLKRTGCTSPGDSSPVRDNRPGVSFLLAKSNVPDN